MIDLLAIENRIQNAEYAAIHIQNHSSIWQHYYEDGAHKNQLINDFKEIVREYRRVQEKLSDAEYKLESLGAKLDD